VQINISTRHGHLSEASQAKLQAKLEKLLHFFERLTAIELTVDLENNARPLVELRVSAEHKHDFVATEQGGELAAAVDAVIQKMEQQLRKYKERVQEHRGPGLRQHSAQTEPETPR
jgi:putative sigma-54 modulation protein